MIIGLCIMGWLLIGFLTSIISSKIEKETLELWVLLIISLLGVFSLFVFLCTLIWSIINWDKIIFDFRDKRRR